MMDRQDELLVGGAVLQAAHECCQPAGIRRQVASVSGKLTSSLGGRLTGFLLLQQLHQGVQRFIDRRRYAEFGASPRHVAVERVDFRVLVTGDVLRG